ncbi:MAG: sigma-70 family RNA polymerase sigma factor [Actinomycetota bacterium]
MSEAAVDRDLVSRYLAGDPHAFDELVRRHEQRVYNLAYRMLGRREDARDAAQDAFVSALRKLPTFRGEAAFSTWLHRVTVNACYDILRKRKRDPDLVEVPEGPATGSDPSDVAAAAVDVQRALLGVPEEYRAVLILHDAQDLSYEEIANILSVPVGTVKSRLHRGRVALGELLEGTTRTSPPSEGQEP